MSKRSMPSKRPRSPKDRSREREWIEDILRNIEAIEAFLHGVGEADFVANTEKQYAVDYALICISEAARRLSPELKRRHSAIPWRQVEDLRSAYTHEYHRLNAKLVWRTASEGLRALREAMRRERGK